MNGLLVVDDEEGVRRSLKRVLEKDGYRIILAENGEEALNIVRNDGSEIETVISDYRMPGMDGLEAMGRILEKHPKIPVVLNSAYSSYKDNFLSWAADAYIIKSADTTELRAKVRELIEARGGGEPTARETE